MSQENADDEAVFSISNSFDVEAKNWDGTTTMLDLSRWSQSKCFTPEDLHLMITKEVSKITEVFPFVSFQVYLINYYLLIIKNAYFVDDSQLPTTKARSFLSIHKWDVNQALERAFEMDYFDDDENNNKPKSSSTDPVECEICLEEKRDKIEVFPCQHKFCDGCISQHISVFLKEASGLPRNAVSCPGFQCSLELQDDNVLRHLCNNADLQSKYLRMITNAYVQSNIYMKWCPRTDCLNAVKINEGAMETESSVRCTCRNWFCFKCNETEHEPLSCEILKKWITITCEEMQSVVWIMQNTKKCPNCKVDIQKNGGCQHMSCRHCKEEFCWICMSKWNGGRHNCDAQSHGTARGDAEDSFPNRFQHFNSHYQKMREIMIKESETFKKNLQTFGHEIELSEGYLKTDFIYNAQEVLHLCRTTLMYSYAFNYYTTTIDNQIYVFEQKLTNLEDCTEKLSRVLQELELDNLCEIKVRLTDAALVSLKCRHYIIENIRDGHEKGWWQKFPISADTIAQNQPEFEDYNEIEFL